MVRAMKNNENMEDHFINNDISSGLPHNNMDSNNIEKLLSNSHNFMDEDDKENNNVNFFNNFDDEHNAELIDDNHDKELFAKDH